MLRVLSVLVALLIPVMALAEEAADRKARSIAVLEAEGVPYLDSLPMIETEAGSLRRSEEEVVRRTIALAIVAVKGETGDAVLADGLVEQFGAEGYFSPAEQAFIDDRAPSQFDRVQFSWRYEGVEVMLWALGIYDDLPRPDGIMDVPRMAETLRTLGDEGLRERARLRPQAELLDAADLIYRYRWAVRQADLDGAEAPAGLMPGVVWERHHALNWLIGCCGLAWDEVDTST